MAGKTRGLVARLRDRDGLPPAGQRKLWARESAAPGAPSLETFRFGPGSSLKVLSMNVFYGQTVDANGEGAAIDVAQYECLFLLGADAVALQECVLGPLPAGSKLANTAASYRKRAPHMKEWVERFPEGKFRSWWPRMKALAKRHGYTHVLECGPGASMYGQKFGNAVFSRVPFGGSCVPALFRKSDFPGETENRSAVVARLPGVTLVNTHLSEKNTKDRRTGETSQSRMVGNLLERAGGGGGKVLIVGDFNKSDPATVPAAALPHYKVAFNAREDAEVYDRLRASGFACLENDRATAWNARHPDQVCSNFLSADELRRAVTVVMPWNGERVVSDHAALAVELP
jgi:endonuclease/exonuclease/phosphatase family metal-dependent hydrolase